MHKLLVRQLKKILGGVEALPASMRPLIDAVDAAYRQADEDRTLLERSLDLTSDELLEANAALRRDQAALARRYQALAEQLPAGVYESDARGRFTYVNPALSEMAGSSREALLVDAWLEAVHPDDRERVMAAQVESVRLGRNAPEVEYRLVRPDGGLVWVTGSARPLVDEDGRIAGFVGTVVDITERRLAEEAIRSSEEKYRMLFEGSRDAIYISTPAGRLLDINPAGVALFGYRSADEMRRIDVGATLYRRPRDREKLLRALEEQGFVHDHEIEVRRRDGEIRVLLATATLVRDVDGRPSVMRGILRDVTVQRALERELMDSRKMEAIGRLAGGVAHDFNNLLTAIVGYAELLARPGIDGDRLKRYSGEIIAAGRRGSALTDQLLAFSRRKAVRPRPVPLNELVGGMESMLRRVIGDDVELRTHLSARVGAVMGDPARIEQVLLNLVVNAREAMPRGGRVEIRTRPARPEEHVAGAPPSVALVVRDTGDGIDEAIRDRIFEPFFTTKEDQGTGLGLATVYGIVEQGGGRIEVQSVKGRGSTFTVLLPESNDAVDSPIPASAVPAAAVAAGSGTVLLVEDEASVRAFVAEYLGGEGYEVLVAPDGLSALAISRGHDGPIDLLLTDLVMPRLGGIALARSVRRERGDLPVLFMSGDVDRSVGLLEDELRRPDVLFLSKPFAGKALMQSLRRLLLRGRAPVQGVVGADRVIPRG